MRLWLYGPPGSGKTILATYTTNNFSKFRDYTCDYDLTSISCGTEVSETGLVWSLCLQMGCRIDRSSAQRASISLPDPSQEHCSESELVRYLWRLLRTSMILCPGHEAIIILDSVDELRPKIRSQFLDSLNDFYEEISARTTVKILISCRDYPDIRVDLKHYVSVDKEKEWRGRPKFSRSRLVLILVPECLATLRFEEWNSRENKITEVERDGTWLSSCTDYREWLSSRHSDIFWISGKPGSGKSTLVKHIMKQLQGGRSRAIWGETTIDQRNLQSLEFSDTPMEIFSSFYYSFRGGRTEKAHELMLRSIAYQIFGQSATLFPLIRDQYRNRKLANLPWQYKDLQIVLHSLHNVTFDLKIFIAIDGLDESDNDLRDDVLEFLSRLTTPKNHCNMKILLASRPETSLKIWMNSVRFVLLEQKNEPDIRLIVESEVAKLEHYRQTLISHGARSLDTQSNEDPLRGIATFIVKHAQGVFLWVSLVLREIKNFVQQGGYSLEDIEHCMRSLPRELGGRDGFYATMVERLTRQVNVSHTYQDRGRRIFAWVSFSTRPVSVNELRDAMATPLALPMAADQGSFNLARARPHDFERGLSSLCGGFVEVRIFFVTACFRNLCEQIRADNSNSQSQSLWPVQLIHQTAREFLLRKDGLAQPYEMDEEFGDTEIAGTCYRYIYLAFTAVLTRDKADTEFSSAAKVAEHFSHFLLLRYALDNFANHLEHLGSNGLAIFAQFERFVADLEKDCASYRALLLTFWLRSQQWPRQLTVSTVPDFAYRCLNSVLASAGTQN